MSVKRLPLAMSPSGVLGRAFGVVMEALNERSYRAAIEVLAPIPFEKILEIGFGTGRFAGIPWQKSRIPRQLPCAHTERLVVLDIRAKLFVK
jgi:hypothetical protein